MLDDTESRTHLLRCGMPFTIKLEIKVLVDTDYLDIGIAINRHDGIQVSLAISSWEGFPKKFSKGIHQMRK